MLPGGVRCCLFLFALKARRGGVRDGPPRARAPDFPREAAEAKSAPPADASVGFLECLEGECETAVTCVAVGCAAAAVVVVAVVCRGLLCAGCSMRWGP